MTTLPVSGTSSPAMTRSSVDLPEPDGPSSAVSDPDGISSETSSSASKSPKRFVMSLRGDHVVGSLRGLRSVIASSVASAMMASSADAA